MSPLAGAAECLLAAGGMGACLWLFASLKSELRAEGRCLKMRQEDAQGSLGALRAAVEDVERRVAETEKQAGLLAPPPPPLSGFNLSKRTQAIRMARRGETPGQIAAALRLPQGEVDLLLKVHRIVLNMPAAGALDRTGAADGGERRP